MPRKIYLTLKEVIQRPLEDNTDDDEQSDINIIVAPLEISEASNEEEGYDNILNHDNDDLPFDTAREIEHKIIEESHHQCGSSASEKLRVQSGKFADVEKVLLQWFKQYRSVEIPISGPLLMEKAQEISNKLNVECDASFSSRWLQKFKLRHDITGKIVSGESGDVDFETVDDWIQNQLPDLIKGYEQKTFSMQLKQITIENCFAFGGVLTPADFNSIENAESDHFVPPENWSNWSSDVTAFEEFAQCDSELPTCSLLTIY
ncbi:hypothetical protein AVEN_130084-1 [Araneus ventricosus]|uniref:HTH CENPB-type domain-containing protein n=1 Tax=Araneus ventricosus TaxID=182803 RepID=A0A4Y2ENN4_ARAVE|nr:hypothetical protein AVEN_130084-1 [Araneus ventricosus]